MYVDVKTLCGMGDECYASAHHAFTSSCIITCSRFSSARRTRSSAQSSTRSSISRSRRQMSSESLKTPHTQRLRFNRTQSNSTAKTRSSNRLYMNHTECLCPVVPPHPPPRQSGRRARAVHRSPTSNRRRQTPPASGDRRTSDDRAWSPWEQPEASDLMARLSISVERHSPPRSPILHCERSPAPAFSDELVGQALPTTDRKKMQLRQLRADVRVRLLELCMTSSISWKTEPRRED